jgi:hypothetical protein
MTYNAKDLERAYSNWGDTPSHLAQMIADVRREALEDAWRLADRNGDDVTADSILELIRLLKDGGK